MEVAERKMSKTAEYFKLIHKYTYFSGWPNFWYADLDVSAFFKRCHGSVSAFMGASCILLVVLELIGFFTQNELSEKQKTDRQLFNISHPVLGSYGYYLTYYQKNVRAFTYSLTVELKEHYNDEKIEAAMVKKARRHSIAYFMNCSSALVLYGLDGSMTCLYQKDGTFVTLITAWPDVNDQSTPAVYFRILAYILWWIFLIRFSTIFVVVISTLVCLGHQYKNLQSYFYSLNNIFEDADLTQKEKEQKYEKGIKKGINMHARTLWCTRECELSFMAMVSGQIVINVSVIILLMAQMLESERSFASVLATTSTLTALLLSTGCFMWNAGDITVEAEALPTAMFGSGWQNCVGDAALRTRKLLVIAMMQAQVPVSIRAFGVTTLSYESYVSIVKSSYSMFSVLY